MALPFIGVLEGPADRRGLELRQQRAVPLSQQEEISMFKGGLLWLIGIPIPIILILWFMGYLG